MYSVRPGRYVPNWTSMVYSALSRYTTARRLPTPNRIIIHAAMYRHTTGCASGYLLREALVCIVIVVVDVVVFGDQRTGWSPAATRRTVTPIGYGRANGRAPLGPRGRSIPWLGGSRHRRR